jgi:L,D-transpeptidase YcbB
MDISRIRVFRMPVFPPLRFPLMIARIAGLTLALSCAALALEAGAEPEPLPATEAATGLAATDLSPADLAPADLAKPDFAKPEALDTAPDRSASPSAFPALPEPPVAELYLGDIALNPPATLPGEPAPPVAEAPVQAPPIAPPVEAADPGMILDLPELPAVVVTLEPPAPASATLRANAGLRLDLDEAGVRRLIEPARVRYRLKPAEIDSFVAAYAVRDFRPFWLAGTGEAVRLGAAAEALAATLMSADRDGLDVARLVGALPPAPKGAIPGAMQPDIDVLTSLAAFLYARDARGGRLEPARLSALLTPKLDLPPPQEVLERLAGAGAEGLGAALAAYQPQHAGYQALRSALAHLREELAAPVLTGSIAGLEGAPHPAGGLPARWLEGEALAPNKADPRVSMLRLRLGMATSASNLYDAELQSAVKSFQRANGLPANGRLTPRTRAALENPDAPVALADRKGDRQALLRSLLANMERWRWLPQDLGAFHVFVNVADFQLKVMAQSAEVHRTRVIVGRPDTQTPIFSDRMEHLIVNPSWGVPASILKKEFLPKLAADPDYAAKRGFQVVRRGNSISIRQPPGERNALGLIKFIFPNAHSVYLHDTPNRSLFSADFRAFSHGCVRVDKPFALAERLLSVSTGLSEPQLRGMVGRGERMIRLQEKIPVHLAYFTVFVDETGVLQQRRDFYGHDARIREALQL